MVIHIFVVRVLKIKVLSFLQKLIFFYFIKKNMDTNPKYAFTKPCNHVCIVDKKETPGVYGVCYKDVCNFAHSMEELQFVLCNFDQNCINERCGYYHSFETKEGFVKRTNKKLPNLPKDNTLSRKKKDSLKASSPKVELVIDLEEEDYASDKDEKEEKKTPTEQKEEALITSTGVVVYRTIVPRIYIYRKDEKQTLYILKEKGIVNYEIEYLD
jgi:hypothetical protein